MLQAAALGLQEKRFRSLEKRGALSQLGQLLGLDNLEIIGGGNNNNNGGGGNGTSAPPNPVLGAPATKPGFEGYVVQSPRYAAERGNKG